MTFLLALSTVYAVIGAVFALWFAAIGVDRYDPAARGAGMAFRALIFPGTAALWPVLLVKLRRGAAHD